MQAVKEDHGKNDLVKNDVERFTRMQQNLIPIWCFQFIFVSVVPYKSLSQQLLQPFILFFLSISLDYFFKKNITTINQNSSVQLARKQKVNSKFCFTG